MTTTVGALLEMHRDIQALRQQHPGVAYLNKGRINEFYKGNGARIENTFKKITALQQEFFVFTDDKEPEIKMTEPVPGVPAKEAVMDGDVVVEPAVDAIPAKPSEPVMQEGKTMKEMDERYDAIMAEKCNLY